jgi:L-fuconolactonase
LFQTDDFRVTNSTSEVSKFVFVECSCDPSQSLDEVKWVVGLAQREPRLQAIVAHAPVELGEALRPRLSALAEFSLVKGARRLLQGESDPEFCLRPNFIAGVSLLAEVGYTFDLCIRHEQLPGITELVRRCPQVQFVLDHAGKPGIRARTFQPWARDLEELAKQPNVSCKISGLTTEAEIASWRPDDLKPYLDHVLTCFGFDRVLYGGDWPVALLATTYQRWLETVQAAVSTASSREQRQLFHDNAAIFYHV